MPFTETLKSVMEHNGLRPVDLQSDDVTATYLSKLLHGKFQEPTWSRACEIVDALGMSLDEFRFFENKEHCSETAPETDEAKSPSL